MLVQIIIIDIIISVQVKKYIHVMETLFVKQLEIFACISCRNDNCFAFNTRHEKKQHFLENLKIKRIQSPLHYSKNSFYRNKKTSTCIRVPDILQRSCFMNQNFTDGTILAGL